MLAELYYLFSNLYQYSYCVSRCAGTAVSAFRRNNVQWHHC